jgi:mRNA-degrading endonuclease RelE of RelBE toxin-antitoxin system
MFEVILHRRAARYFQRLDPKLQGQLRTKFEVLGRDPLGQPGIKPMAGEWDGFHRLRHGSSLRRGQRGQVRVAPCWLNRPRPGLIVVRKAGPRPAHMGPERICPTCALP